MLLAVTPFLSRVGEILGALVFIVALSATVYGLSKYIDSRIKSLFLQDRELLRKIAQAARPIAIFDQKGTVLYDGGASEFIESLSVKLNEEPGSFAEGFPKEIVIKSKRFLHSAPLIVSIDPDDVEITSRRSAMSDWIYRLEYSGYSTREVTRFRIEILR